MRGLIRVTAARCATLHPSHVAPLVKAALNAPRFVHSRFVMPRIPVPGMRVAPFTSSAGSATWGSENDAQGFNAQGMTLCPSIAAAEKVATTCPGTQGIVFEATDDQRVELHTKSDALPPTVAAVQRIAQSTGVVVAVPPGTLAALGGVRELGKILDKSAGRAVIIPGKMFGTSIADKNVITASQLLREQVAAATRALTASVVFVTERKYDDIRQVYLNERVGDPDSPSWYVGEVGMKREPEFIDGENKLAASLSARVQDKRHVVILIHGFNNGLSYELSRIGQLSKELDLGPDAVYLGYNWPCASDNERWYDEPIVLAQDYAQAQTMIEDSAFSGQTTMDGRINTGVSARRFAACIEAVRKAAGSNAIITLVAHSMGNRLALGACKVLAQNESSNGVIDHLISAAADEASDVFAAGLVKYRAVANRVLHLTSKFDWALIVSTLMHANKRAGRELTTEEEQSMRASNIQIEDMGIPTIREAIVDPDEHAYFVSSELLARVLKAYVLKK